MCIVRLGRCGQPNEILMQLMVVLSAEESWVSGRAGPTFSEYHVVPPRQQWDILGESVGTCCFCGDLCYIYIYMYIIYIF